MYTKFHQCINLTVSLRKKKRKLSIPNREENFTDSWKIS